MTSLIGWVKYSYMYTMMSCCPTTGAQSINLTYFFNNRNKNEIQFVMAVFRCITEDAFK